MAGPFGVDASPAAVGQAGVGLAAGGAILSVIGAFAGAQSMRSSLAFQADMARINQAIAESNARAMMLTGQRDEQRSRLATARLKSSQEAAMAANGIDIGVGSAALVRTSTDFMGEVDVNTIKANATRAAFGYRTQATNFGNDALLKDASASAVSPFAAAAGTFLTGAGKVASSWYALAGTSPSGTGLTTGDFARMDRGQP